MRRVITVLFIDITDASDAGLRGTIRQADIRTGAEGRLLARISNDLQERLTYVSVPVQGTRLYCITRKVPQGEVLSPALLHVTLT